VLTLYILQFLICCLLSSVVQYVHVLVMGQPSLQSLLEFLSMRIHFYSVLPMQIA